MRRSAICAAALLLTLGAATVSLACHNTCTIDGQAYACDVDCDPITGCAVPASHAACDVCAGPNVIGQDGKCVICATGSDEDITGTTGDDVICAKGGDDTVNGNGGDDIVDGSTGVDTVVGGSGDDKLFGGGGNDIVIGQGGSDLLSGDGGSDIVLTHLFLAAADEDLGSDVCGGSGNDTLYAFNFDQQCIDGGGGTGDVCNFFPPANRQGNDVGTHRGCETINVSDQSFLPGRNNTCRCP